MRQLWLYALSALLILTVTLAGCTSDEEGNPVSQRPEESHSALDSQPPRASVPNDAAQGGGAGGTNDTDNDGIPDADAEHSVHPSDALEDLKDAADDLLHGAGDALEDAGDGMKRAAGKDGGR